MFWGSTCERDKRDFQQNKLLTKQLQNFNTIIVSKSTLNDEWNTDLFQDIRIKRKL